MMSSMASVPVLAPSHAHAADRLPRQHNNLLRHQVATLDALQYGGRSSSARNAPADLGQRLAQQGVALRYEERRREALLRRRDLSPLPRRMRIDDAEEDVAVVPDSASNQVST